MGGGGEFGEAFGQDGRPGEDEAEGTAEGCAGCVGAGLD